MYLLNLETISKGICRLLASLKIPLDIFLPIALPAGAACLPAIQFAGFLYSYTHCFMYISWFFFAFSTPVTSPTFHFSAALFFQPMFAYVNRNVWRPEWGALCIYAHANIPFFSSHMCNAALFNIKWRLIPGSTSILRGKGQVQHQNGRVVCDMSDILWGWHLQFAGYRGNRGPTGANVIATTFDCCPFSRRLRYFLASSHMAPHHFRLLLQIAE